MSDLRAMMASHARPGRVAWIGLRASRREKVAAVERARIGPAGLEGDHAPMGLRAVTLIQMEHLPVIAALAGLEAVPPETLRRNLGVTGINLAALKGRPLRVGSARLRITGPCHPCSRMEEALGPGGYSAVRGHGGWYAEVVTPGTIALRDAVEPEEA